MMKKPLPSVDEAFLIVQQQERRYNAGIMGSQLPQTGENLNGGSVFLSQGLGGILLPRKPTQVETRSLYVVIVDIQATRLKNVTRGMDILPDGNQETEPQLQLIRFKLPHL